MAEYWKSTPKYWCKFCSIFVKDTKLERAQHEATGRHQGNIQRSLRGLHREQESEQRKQQWAKDEVARLNGIVPSAKTTATTGSNSNTGNDARVGAKPTFSKEKRPATLDDRKRQIEQLAAMGVAVPDAMRGDMALKGEWEVVSKKVIGEEEKPLNTGVRKRKMDEVEQEVLEAGEMITKKKGWGNTFKSFPGKLRGAGDDDEALFKMVKRPVVKSEGEEVKEESAVKNEQEVKEEGGASSLQDIPTQEEAAEAIKKEEESATPAPAVVFKKRKKIAR